MSPPNKVGTTGQSPLHRLFSGHIHFRFLTYASFLCPTTDSLGPHRPKARLLITTGTNPSPGTTSPISMKSNSHRLTSSIHGMFHLADSMPPTTCPTFET